MEENNKSVGRRSTKFHDIENIGGSSTSTLTHIDILERLGRDFYVTDDRDFGGGASSKYNVSSGVRSFQKWTLYHDAQMASLLQHFTRHVQKRSADVSDAILSLEDKIRNQLENDILSTRDQVYLYSNRHYVKNTIVVTDTNNEGKINLSSSSNNVNSSKNNVLKEQTQQKEKEVMNDDIFIDDDFDEVEEMAIMDGMKALEIYYHPDYNSDSDDDYHYDNEHQQNKNNNNSFFHKNNFNTDHFFQMEDEGYGAEDSCYYYESCKKDIFNQRPLPYIISTPEFQQSKDVGLGSDEDEIDDAYHGSEVLNNSKDNEIFPNYDANNCEVITNTETDTTPIVKNKQQRNSTLETN